jgi:hypothetical protein
MLFGRCKACVAQEKHIESLKLQIADLKAVMQPSALRLSPSQLEADAVLSGTTDAIEVDESDFTPEQLAQLENEQREAAAVLSGSY